jgi:hypothetical protein
VTLQDALVDALARIVFAREAIELEEYAVAATVLRDLEEDLAVVLERTASEAAS